LGVIAAAVAVVVAGFVIASSGVGTKHAKPLTQAPSGAAASGAGAPPTGPVRIVIKGGKPVGGVTKISVKKGDRVRFTVTSDVADEVHVHGYDLHRTVKKGGMVSFDFPATIDGEFEAELESRKEQILALAVQP
jgi:plastocyanin